MFPETDDGAAVTRCVRRAALERRPRPPVVTDGNDKSDLWYVKVTLSGAALPRSAVHQGLSRLTAERAFVVSARYGDDRAEVRYWDEADDAESVIAQAVNLWGGSEAGPELPGWRMTGLEVLDRLAARAAGDSGALPVVRALGEIVPLDA